MDRNGFYWGPGYGLPDVLPLQLGYMQQPTGSYSKGQLQVSFHHTL